MDQCHQAADGRCWHADLTPEFSNHADLRINFGLAFAHGQVAVNTGVRFGGVAVELGQGSNGGACPGVRCTGRKTGRIKPIEPDRHHTACCGYRHHFTRQPVKHHKTLRVFEIHSHRVGGQRGSEQHRTVCQLAPQVAPDVVGQHCSRLKNGQVAVHLPRTFTNAAVNLAHHDGGAITEKDVARAQPVSTEIDKTTHGALSARQAGNRQLIEAVLRREHKTICCQMGQQHGHCSFGCLRLDSQHDGAECALQLLRCDTGDNLPELLDWAADVQPCRAASTRMLRHDVHHLHRHTGTRPIGTEYAANGTCAPDQDGFTLRHHGLPIGCSWACVATVISPSVVIQPRYMPSVL